MAEYDAVLIDAVADEILFHRHSRVANPIGIDFDQSLPFGSGPHYDFEVINPELIAVAISENHTTDYSVYSAYTTQVPYDDFYNRIHVNPVNYDVGNLLSDFVGQVKIWNAYADDKEISSLTIVDQEGFVLEIDPVGAYPFDLAGYQQITYTYRVQADGPASIEAGLEWLIDTKTYNFNVTGQRLVNFNFAPEWSGGFTEWYEYRTQIEEAFNKEEDRSSLREHPRIGLQYKGVYNGRELNLLQTRLWSWQNRVFGIPVYSRPSRLGIAADMDDTTITLGKNARGLSVGNLGIIFSGNNYETFVVEYVIGNNIGLETGLLSDWPLNSLVYPVIQGTLPIRVPYAMITDGVAEYSFNFSALPSNFSPFLPDYAFPTSYKGVPALTEQPNWEKSLNYESIYEVDIYDYGGKKGFSETAERPSFERLFTWLLKNHDEVDAHLGLIKHLAGMRNTIFIPTWRNDLVLVGVVGAADTTLTVRDDEYIRFIDSDESRSDLFIELKNGTFFLREMTGVDTAGENLSVGIDSALGQTVAPEQVSRISFLIRYRSASDGFNIDWITAGVAKTSIVFKEVIA